MNPPKLKYLTKSFAAVPGAVWRWLTARLAPRAMQAWAWLQSHVDGWQFEIEQLAAGIGVSLPTAYRAVADLESARMLDRSNDIWTLSLPILTSENPRDQEGRAGASARSLSGKNQERPTHPTEDRNVEDPATPTEANAVQNPTPVKTRPNTLAPDRHGRRSVCPDDRVNLSRFLAAWRQEFQDGPCAGSMMVLPNSWQQRVLWVWQHWTASEIRDAFRTTRDSCPRKAWSYFVSILERIAAGTFDDKVAKPDSSLLAEVKRLCPGWEYKPWTDVPIGDVYAYARAFPGARADQKTSKQLEEIVPPLRRSGLLDEEWWKP